MKFVNALIPLIQCNKIKRFGYNHPPITNTFFT